MPFGTLITNIISALVLMSTSIVPEALAQPAAQRPEFEVISVKTNTGCQSGSVTQQPFRPGRLHFACMSLEAMMQFAYGTFGNGVSRSSERVRIVGLPNWDASERFAVDAKATEGTRVEMMAGPMLQSLLQGRFSLRVHHEAREVPLYDLVVGKNHPKLRQTKEGGCVLLDPSNPPQLTSGEPPPRICGDRSTNRAPGGIYSFDFYGMTLLEFCRFLGPVVGRTVKDKTELGGRFDFHLEFSPEETDSSSVPSIFSAVEQQLGLKLVSQKGPVEFLVIDHVEKPSGN
jgi:uncharacterized protein (TIGR03435 family)